jgi:SAM-dependent methyltransferase
VTRKLAALLPRSAAIVAIVAMDLNQPMLDQAEKIGTSRPLE